MDRVLIDIVWATDAHGSISIYRRDGNESSWTKVFEKKSVPTLQYEGNQPAGDHYWKAGFYRSESKVTSRLRLGPIVRGRDQDEVTLAAFGRR